MSDDLKKIEVMRKIVEEKTAAKFDGFLIDLFSAGHVLAVYDNISEENQAKYIMMGVPRMVDMAYDVLK